MPVSGLCFGMGRKRLVELFHVDIRFVLWYGK